MAEKSTDRFQIQSRLGSKEFYDLLRNLLPGKVYKNIRKEIYHRFHGLNGDGQRSMLHLLRFHCMQFLSRDPPSMVVASILGTLADLEDPLNASIVLIPSDIAELSRAIEKVETVATFLISMRSSLNMSSNINFSHPNSEAGTLHHTQRTLPVQHNSHLTDGASTQYDLMPVPSHHIPPDYGRVSINMNNTNLNYSTNTQSHSQRSIASSHGIFQATEISPYGDPGASSSSTSAASHGEARAARDDVTARHSGIFQATEISPYGDPGVSSSSTAAASHGEMSNSLQSHSQRPAASHNNPPGHDAVINVPAGHSGILQATEISHGDPGASSSSTAAASHGQTTRDGETAGHSKLFEILVPVNFNYAHKAGNILKSTYDSLSPSIKTSGYLTVAIASVAAFSSLAGLSLSTFKPNTLPFGWNPQLMLQIMHILTVFFFGYAFIGTMCHEFLHDDPIIFWMVEGLAYAILTAVLVFIIWRR